MNEERRIGEGENNISDDEIELYENEYKNNKKIFNLTNKNYLNNL